MNALQLMAAIGLITGAFLLLGLSPLAFADGLFGFLNRRSPNLRAQLREATGRRKPSFWRRELLEAQQILQLTGRSERFSLLCAASLLLFAIGASLAVLLSNLFLVPVLALGFMLLPFWRLRLTASHFKKNLAAELETALSIITTAYLRSEDVVTAVEESAPYLNPPVRQVFERFLLRVRRIDPDVPKALGELKAGIDHEVFAEWCDAVAACQQDRTLKTTLTPIVAKLSELRIVNGELEYLVAEPRKEFIMMVLLVIGNVPLMAMLNREWYHTLMHTLPGQLVLAVCAAVILVSTSFVIRLTQPIVYRR